MASSDFEPRWTCKYRRPKNPIEAQHLYNHIRTVAYLLDASSEWLIPSFPFLASLPSEMQFGLDSVVGVILPGLGDVIGVLLSCYQLFLSMLFGLPLNVIGIMVFYILADAFIGMIPFIGDFLDVAFKANLYNLKLLEKELKRSRWASAQIILFDQRGAGKSTPSASLEENTTWDLVKDMEKLRGELKIDKWHVFGGSWVRYPRPSFGLCIIERLLRVPRFLWHTLKYGTYLGSRVVAYFLVLVTSGSCQEFDPKRDLHAQEKVRDFLIDLSDELTQDRSELKFFYQEGASHLFPEAWDEYIAPIPEGERHDMILAYHAQLNSVDETTRIEAAKAWSKWEMATSKLYVDPSYIKRAESDEFANALSAFARIENHYFINDGFMRDGQLLEKQEIDKIRHIPCIVVQGRYDVVCPATTAYALKKVWSELELHIVPDAGHSAREIGIAKLLVEATNKFADLE
ncbi:hypothetical protein D9757_002421 [Collybiopsis confluens]|uniref:AB hydrolase-1 domain-containing protein n=1 Tax=Collybiopsis confluens TaxID=2823264 RepID=A0A8H5HXZ9_9AGAR|nr:hypothetical protein D9757_002421 [Collybiopsis confluens]